MINKPTSRFIEYQCNACKELTITQLGFLITCMHCNKGTSFKLKRIYGEGIEEQK